MSDFCQWFECCKVKTNSVMQKFVKTFMGTRNLNISKHVCCVKYHLSLVSERLQVSLHNSTWKCAQQMKMSRGPKQQKNCNVSIQNGSHVPTAANRCEE
jgi:hypothetical protein